MDLIKKRAVKRTKTISYRREIHQSVLSNPGNSKDEICRLVKGSRTVVFTQINKLIDEKILDYNNGKLTISTTTDIVLKQNMLNDQLGIFRETRDNTITRIKERLEKSPTKSIYYQKSFRATDPEHSTKDHTEYKTIEINHINDEAKTWIFLIPQQLDQIIRGSFSLYVSQMLAPISSESYKEIFETSIKEVLKEIKKTKKMLLTLIDKKDKEFFEGWWWQLTVGLTLDDVRITTEGHLVISRK